MSKEKLTDDIFPDCKVVDDFVKSFYGDEIKLDPKADSTDFFNEKGKITSLTDFLSNALTNYTTAKSSLLACQIGFSKLKRDSSMISLELKEFERVKTWRMYLLQAITHAKSLNLIVETDSTVSKLKKSEQEKEDLKEKNARLQKLNNELVKENCRLHKLFPDNQKGKSEVGELSSV